MNLWSRITNGTINRRRVHIPGKGLTTLSVTRGVMQYNDRRIVNHPRNKNTFNKFYSIVNRDRPQILRVRRVLRVRKAGRPGLMRRLQLTLYVNTTIRRRG